MRLDDMEARRARHGCLVARIATMSRSGRPSVNPLYYVVAKGEILLGTSTWTLAARNINADPRVCLLFEAESGHPHTALRVTGRAEVRTERRVVRGFVWRSARHNVLPVGALRNVLEHWRQHRLRMAYYAQSADRGRPCVIAVAVDHVEVINSAAVDGTSHPTPKRTDAVPAPAHE